LFAAERLFAAETVQICTAKCVAQITLDGRLNMFAASCLSYATEFAINLKRNVIRKKLDLSLLFTYAFAQSVYAVFGDPKPTDLPSTRVRVYIHIYEIFRNRINWIDFTISSSDKNHNSTLL
jgi:hypothetical protein